MNVTVKVSSLLNPTEMKEKVEKAISNFIPVELMIKESEINEIYGEGDIESLRKLRRSLREERILDTFRHILIDGIEGNTTRFLINKQVAHIGKLNIPAGEESLGSIHVEISAQNREELMEIIDWLAPETIDGKPVMEIEL